MRRTKAEVARVATEGAERAEVDCRPWETTTKWPVVQDLRIRLPKRSSAVGATRNRRAPFLIRTKTDYFTGWPFWLFGSSTIYGRSSSGWPSPNSTRAKTCSPGTCATPSEMLPTPWTSPSSSVPATWSRASWSTTAAN